MRQCGRGLRGTSRDARRTPRRVGLDSPALRAGLRRTRSLLIKDEESEGAPCVWDSNKYAGLPVDAACGVMVSPISVWANLQLTAPRVCVAPSRADPG